MCLKSPISMEEVKTRLPQTDEFYVYKLVERQGGRLKSPHYEYQWLPGKLHANLSYQSNGDAGFYVMLVNLGNILSAYDGKALLRLRVNKEDIVAGGLDQIAGVSATCLVVKTAVLEEEDYKNALNTEQQKVEVHAFEQKVAEEVKEMVKRADEKQEEAEITAKKASKKSKKVVKKDEEKLKKIVKKSNGKAKKQVKKSEKQKGLAGETISVLKTTAKALGIQGVTKMTKELLIKTIKKAQRVMKNKEE